MIMDCMELIFMVDILSKNNFLLNIEDDIEYLLIQTILIVIKTIYIRLQKKHKIFR